MALDCSEEHLTKAFCQSLVCTNIGAAVNNCPSLFPQTVKKVVPLPMHDEYPARLLGCVISVCTSDPYGWSVDQIEPVIGDDTTFGQLYNGWFKGIIS